jgi:hypothetical protein
MKLGMAIAANRPMMATTIIISTKVKPAMHEALLGFMFPLFDLALRRERYNRRVIRIMITICAH